MKVTLLALAWDEIDGMQAIMPRIKKEWCDQIVVVDGGSTDGTFGYARDQGYDVFVQQGQGSGAAFREGMERVTGDIVIPFSPDGNSDPERIPHLVAKLKEGYDLVVCSRYLQWASSDDDDLVTAFGNKMFTGLVNLLFSGQLTDLLVMYRAFRKDIVKELGARSPTDAWGTEIMLKALKKKLKITEIPGNEPARIGGERKMKPLKNGFLELQMIFKEFFVR
ncbi:hypothetical protein D1AOALGA4SA_9705 [Olavius algarvensis Delta 1 endosymbiont]|nr:hypothetical protein D1AOALGA4SA_9705 [Olavius algarvensis Delta 1 endosymbiont]